ncbi:hypothetical protein AK88_00239 [Plasmodium fragile]|uniref:Uncharacterized protein n=1 Tax=Plasmodium fragile TaxID=5857 RepID=A0A0D9QSP1_PLAFR|nr:uncharacterized protein AK88_00239 [Plasmodium fragile]KJP90070.1 hypothetical protein AK88_00239 [Plasmodium fragile]
MEAASSYDRNDTLRSAKNGSTKNNKEQQDEQNNSNLLTIYSFISSYVFKEDMNYDENDSRYELLESQDLENESCDKKVSFSEYNEKVYRYYRGRNGSDQVGEVEHQEYECDHEEEEEEEDERAEDDEEEDEYNEDDEEGDDDEDEEEEEEDEGDCAADSDVHALASANEEDIIVQGSVPRKKGKSRNLRKKATSRSKNNMTSMKDKKYRNKLYKKGKKNKIHNVNEDYKEDHSNGPIKRNISNISKYFMLSMDNINEQQNIFKDEKQLSRQMSYYNDAYYYTSEMIYKNNKRHKEKLALYLRLMSLFINIMIGIYLITHFPHTNNEFEINSQNGHSWEHDNLKEIIRSTLYPAKNGAPRVYYGDSADAHVNTLSSQNEVLQNNEKKRKYLDILFRGSSEAKEKEKQKEANSPSPWKDENDVDSKQKNKDDALVTGNSSNLAAKSSKGSTKETPQVNNQIIEMDIVNLVHDEYVMQYIYMEMNKIYKYAIYSFFGELLVISIIVLSLFILRIIIKDNNKFSVILTMYGILYKIFCYIFAHYVLIMGLYILSIYYNIYINKDVTEYNFNFFCYHYVCNNLHIHLLMLFYAFQNIIFTINDAFNCIRMMFIIFKHVIITIYEKITCKNFITFYELKEDKSPLSLNCMNKFKKKCNMNNKCCRDKTCVEIDIDEIHELEYDKSQLPFPSLHQKPYCKNLDIKTYEQSLLNMRNPIFK